MKKALKKAWKATLLKLSSLKVSSRRVSSRRMSSKRRYLLVRLPALLVIMCFLLTACGQAKTSKADNRPEFVYVPEYQTFPEGTSVNSSIIKGSRIYFTNSTVDEATGAYSVGLSYLDIGGTEPVTIPLTMVENEYPSCFNIDADGNLYIITQISNYDATTQVSQNVFKMTKLDATGNVLFTQDISSIFDSPENAYIQYIEIDGDNNIYLSNGQDKIWLFDSNGTAKGSIAVTSWINDMTTTKEGKVVVCSYETNGYVVKEVDPVTKALGESYEGIPNSNGSFIIATAADTGFLISSGNTLKQYDTTSKTTTDILNWVNCDINYSNITAMSALEDGRIAVITSDYSEATATTDIVILTKTASSEVTEKTILTYGSLNSDSEIMKQIIAFNKSNEKYRIEVKEYGTEDYETGITQMNTDIIAGNGPDIINVSYGSSINEYIAKGVLADLTPYLDADTEIKKEDYLTNVLDAYSVDGKKYAIIPSFSISSVIGKASEVGTDMGWTVDDIMSLAKNKPEGTELLEYATKSSMLSTLVMYDLNQYVDWNTGKCSFDSDEFIKVLEFSNTFPDEANYNEDAPSTYTKIKDGSLLLIQASFSGTQEYQMYSQMFGEPIAFKGFPTKNGNGSSIQTGGVTLAINANTENMDGAWEFVRSFMLPDYQNNLSWNFPILKSALDATFKKAMTPDYFTDENGKQVEQVKTSWGWNDFTADIYAATQTDVDAITALINSATTVSDYDEQMYNIISEEAGAYFDGSKEAKDVADIIQSRIQIYISESR